MSKEAEDAPSEDDEVSLNKKRTREEKEAEDRVSSICIPIFSIILSLHWWEIPFPQIYPQKSRGNYRCSKCNVPKKGHVCPYQPRFRRRDQAVEGGIFWLQCWMKGMISSYSLHYKFYLVIWPSNPNCNCPVFWISDANCWNAVWDGRRDDG